MWREIESALRAELAADSRAAALIPGLEAGVAAGRVSPVAAAREVLDAFLGRRGATAKHSA
jgi:hypothetical protein